MMRTRGDNCLSDLRLDELLAGELAPAERSPATAHLDGCRTCAARLTALESERDRFRAETSVPLRRPARRALGLGVGIAAAAGFAAILFHGPRPETSATRSKGVARLGLFIEHGGHVRPGGPRETVHPGDTLSFTVSAERRVHVAVLSRDGAGRANIYFPAGETTEAVEPGRDVLLPLATVLDGTLGAERLHGLLCDRPVALAPLVRALDAGAELPVPPGCSLETISLEKLP